MKHAGILSTPLAALALLLVAGCVSPEPPSPPTEEPTELEREARLDGILGGLADRIHGHLGSRTSALGPMLKEREDFEPRMAAYVSPKITRALLARGAEVVERRDLDRIVAELKIQHSDLFDETSRPELGALAGAEVLLLGVVADRTATVYRLTVKGVELATGRVLFSETADLDRELLPIRYGGI